MAADGWCHSFIHGTVLTYSTVKVVKVQNTYIAIIHRLLQLLIFFYIIGYIVLWKKGYQQSQEPRGTSVIKVKGVAKLNGNNSFFYTSGSTEYIWDTPEYEVPPIENNAFFITTHQTVTYDQTLTICATSFDEKKNCTEENKNTTCPANQPLPSTTGYFTGECVNSIETPVRKVCEMYGWCPQELSKSTEFIINEEELNTFTIFLKTMVTFTEFKKTLRNIQDDTDFRCRFDGTPATADCPILGLGYILNQLGDVNRPALLLSGGLIEIRQNWQCNFDLNPDKCVPTYTFSLLQSGDDKQSPGINYRSIQKYRINETDYRTLTKSYGLRFIVSITGKGGQFDIVNLFLAIGSGIGFMVIAGIVADMVFMYIHRSRETFRDRKFSVLEVDNKTDDDNHILVVRNDV